VLRNKFTYVVIGFLALHAALLSTSMRRNFVTVDETGHIPSGLAYWQTGSFAAYRVNPPLPRLLAVLPILGAAHTNYSIPKDFPGARSEWYLARAFAEANREHYFELVCLTRWAGVAWSLLGGVLIFLWAKDLFGPLAACLGLVLWCLEPTVLAHAGLATTDVPAAVMGLTACYLFRNYIRQPTWTKAWFAGLLLGLAQLTKFTLLALYPLWLLLAVLFWWGRREGRLRTRLAQGLVILAASLLTIHVGYGFENSFQRLGDFSFVSKAFQGESSSNRFAETIWANLPMPVPANFILGLDSQRHDFESRWPVYLGGKWREGGWWYFYPYAFGVKLPLGTLILLGISLFLAFRTEARAGWREECALLVPGLGLLALVIWQSNIQNLRYALPALPFLFIWASRIASVGKKPQGRLLAALLVAGLLLWNAWSCLAIHPHYLSYFNEIAGGPENGPDHLVDSNQDWGQDLLFLKAWLDEHPEVRPLGLAYFNIFDPGLLGIDYYLPPLAPKNKSTNFRPKPGYYAVSTHFVRGGSFSAARQRHPFRSLRNRCTASRYRLVHNDTSVFARKGASALAKSSGQSESDLPDRVDLIRKRSNSPISDAMVVFKPTASFRKTSIEGVRRPRSSKPT
jgi:hypothetical protein